MEILVHADSHFIALANAEKKDAGIMRDLVSISHQFATHEEEAVRDRVGWYGHAGVVKKELDAGNFFIVAYVDSKPVGFVEFNIETRDGELPRRVYTKYTAVLPQYQRMGVANRLTRNLVGWARRNRLLLVHRLLVTDASVKWHEKWAAKKPPQLYEEGVRVGDAEKVILSPDKREAFIWIRPRGTEPVGRKRTRRYGPFHSR